MKKYCFIGMILVLVSMTCACATKEKEKVNYPDITITGDVTDVCSFSPADLMMKESYEYHGENCYGIPIVDLIQQAVPLQKEYSIYLTAGDGVGVMLKQEELSDCAIALSKEDGWVCVAKNHPPQAGIQDIKQILVCADEIAGQTKCLRLIDGDKEEGSYTYGQLFFLGGTTSYVLEGKAEKAGNTIEAYTKRTLIPLSSLFSEVQSEEVLLYQNGGAQVVVPFDGFLQWQGNSVDYVYSDKRGRKKDVIGIWADYIKDSVTDIYDRVLKAADQGNVMIIELDGLGYEKAKSHNLSVIPMRTVMPSVSTVALGSILTGKTPDIAGVPKEKMRTLAVPDFFELLSAKGKSCAMIEGDSVLIQTSIDQQLNADINQDGYTDDEVFLAAQKEIEKGTNIMYVHFHGIDDCSHNYGPNAKETDERIEVVSSYVEKLCNMYDGTVFLCADHGQHTVDLENKKGEHGDFLPLDMITPFQEIHR